MAKPVVDGLEQREAARMDVVRVDVATASGHEFAARYGIAAVPAYVLLSPRGGVLYRQVGGRPNVDAIATRLHATAEIPR